MPRSKKCVKDLDTEKCRKAIKSGRPRCSGRRSECVSDASGKYCRKSRKPGRPRVSKRIYKKRCDTGKKPRKKRSDCGKPRKKRSDTGKRRYKKSCNPRKRRSDKGKPRSKRSFSKGESITSMDDYKNFLKISTDETLLRDLLEKVGVTAPATSDTADANMMLDVAATNVSNTPDANMILDVATNVTDEAAESVNASNPDDLKALETYGKVQLDDNWGWGAYLTSDGATSWSPENELPESMKAELADAKAESFRQQT